MFTGLIEAVGIVSRIDNVAGGAQVEIYAPDFGRDMAIGDSVATDGACLTIAKFARGSFVADISGETLDRTTLGDLHTGVKVNLERAMRLSDRLGGHMVSGHIDGVGRLMQRHVSANSIIYQFQLPEGLIDFLIEKGSVAINGVSLTIARMKDDMIACAVIPHTEENTTLKHLTIGQPVNVEVDMIGKYVRRFVTGFSGEGGSLSDIGTGSPTSNRLGEKLRDFMEGY